MGTVVSFKRDIDVLGLGSIAVDYIGRLVCWPRAGVKTRLESLDLCDGGLIATALVAVSRLGGTTEFAGKLGDSDWARRAAEMLRKENVGTSFLIHTKNAEPLVAFVLSNISNGERNIFWTDRNVQYPFPAEFADKAWYRKVKVLLIDSRSGKAGIEAAEVAQRHSVPVVIDAEEGDSYVTEAMSVSSHIVVSENFAGSYTGKQDISAMLRVLRTPLAEAVVITRGEKGCAGSTCKGDFELPAAKVDVVDSTGCGDVFHGAYALAVARGLTAYKACEFATAAAGLCASRVGGRFGIPTVDELTRFMKSHQQASRREKRL